MFASHFLGGMALLLLSGSVAAAQLVEPPTAPPPRPGSGTTSVRVPANAATAQERLVNLAEAQLARLGCVLVDSGAVVAPELRREFLKTTELLPGQPGDPPRLVMLEVPVSLVTFSERTWTFAEREWTLRLHAIGRSQGGERVHLLFAETQVDGTARLATYLIRMHGDAGDFQVRPQGTWMEPVSCAVVAR